LMSFCLSLIVCAMIARIIVYPGMVY
jgi:hypothetical protein